MKKGSRHKNFFKLFCSLFVLWLIVGSELSISWSIYGVGFCAVFSFITIEVTRVLNHKGDKFFILDVNIIGLFSYLIWLFEEIVKGTYHTAKAVLGPNKSLKRDLVVFKCSYDNPMATALLMNSIILIPGAVSLHATEDGIFYVHTLTEKGKQSILSGEMQDRIASLYGEEVRYIKC